MSDSYLRVRRPLNTKITMNGKVIGDDGIVDEEIGDEVLIRSCNNYVQGVITSVGWRASNV